MKEIIIRNLRLSYGDKVVLHNFSAQIPVHSVTCLMGESGSGKTTLLYALAGLKKADQGEIFNIPKKISVVFQEDRLFEEFTAFKNISAVCRKTKTENPEEKARFAFKAVGLKDYEDKKVGEFSGGMKRRVAIVRAVLYESDLIVMDEPFKGIDEMNKEKVMKFLAGNRGERGILFTTHNVSEAVKMGAKIIDLNAHRGDGSYVL